MAELQTTLRDIAAAIVDHPDEVAVTCEETEDSVTLTLSVAPDDMGMVIESKIRGIEDSWNRRFMESRTGVFLHSALHGAQRRVSSV